jgi:hypothetical protein
MWISVLDHGSQWFGRLLVFAQGDPFERFAPEPETTSPVEVAAVLTVLSLVAAAAVLLARILL